MIHHGHCIEVMAQLDAESVDAIVTDPPYGLEFMGKEWDRIGADSWRSVGGFSKPGFGDRPTEWASYGSGDTANATCATCNGRMRGAKRCKCDEPMWTIKGRPIGESQAAARNARSQSMQEWHEAWAREAFRIAKPGAHLLAFGGTRTYHRLASAIEDAGWEIRDCLVWAYASGFPKSHNLDGAWKGWGTALKPAWEPIVMARKPLAGTVAANVQAHGTGALNIDGCRIPSDDGYEKAWDKPVSTNIGAGRYITDGRMHTVDISVNKPSGRWPANVVLTDPIFDGDTPGVVGGDTGNYSRFFLVSKASRKDREPSGWKGERLNTHPTVKPTDLMRHLVRLVTPPGGVVLDPFLGSGTTALAAEMEGFAWIGIEREAEYVAIAEARLGGIQRTLELEADR